MSAILHSISTSIENDRISEQLGQWFEGAGLRMRREHKEKFAPVLVELKMFEEHQLNVEEDQLDDVIEQIAPLLEEAVECEEEESIKFWEDFLYRAHHVIGGRADWEGFMEILDLLKQ